MAELLEAIRAEIEERQDALTTAMRERDELRGELEKREEAILAHGDAVETLKGIESLAAELPHQRRCPPTGKTASTRRAAPAGPPRQPTRRATTSRRRAGEASGSTPAARAASPARRPASGLAKHARKGVTTESVLEFIRRRGSVTVADINDEFKLDGSARYHLQKLLEAKQVAEAGTRGQAKIYRPAEQVPSPETAEHATARQEPALEGRILQLLCHKYLTPAQVAAELDVPATDVMVVIGKLREDGDVDRLPDGRYRGHE